MNLIHKIPAKLLGPAAVAILLALSYVLMGIWIRLMAGSFASWQQVWARIMLAAIIALVVFGPKIRWQLVRKLRPVDWGIYFVRGILSYVVGVGMFTIAIQEAPLATVSLVSSLPLMGVFGWLMFRERVRLWSIPFIGLSVVGLLLVTGVTPTNLVLGPGVLAALVGLIGFDIGYLMSRHQPKQLSNFENTTLMLLVGWAPILVVSLVLGEPLLASNVSPIAWVALVISAISNVVGLIGINFVFQNLKAYVAGNLLLTESVFAIIVGYLIYHEVPTPAALLGAVIILVCGYAVSAIDARGDRLEAAQLEGIS